MWLECAELVCGGAVAFGLVLEVALAVINPPYGHPFERWGPVICDVFVAVGVVGEILFARRVASCQGELTRRSNEKLEKAHELARVADGHAATAWTRTVRLQEELTEAIDRLAAAEIEAAEARLRTAEIEQLTAWRRITAEQRRQVAEFSQQFEGEINLLIEFQASDPEAFTYARDIWQAFNDAGVHPIRVTGNQYLSGSVFGLQCVSQEDAFSLPMLLTFFPWMTCAEEDLSTHLPRSEQAPNLYIFVGPKPPPDIVWDAATPPESVTSTANIKAK